MSINSELSFHLAGSLFCHPQLISTQHSQFVMNTVMLIEAGIQEHNPKLLDILDSKTNMSCWKIVYPCEHSSTKIFMYLTWNMYFMCCILYIVYSSSVQGSNQNWMWTVREDQGHFKKILKLGEYVKKTSLRIPRKGSISKSPTEKHWPYLSCLF